MIVEATVVVAELVKIFGADVAIGLGTRLSKPHFTATLVRTVRKDLPGHLSDAEAKRLRGVLGLASSWGPLIGVTASSQAELVALLEKGVFQTPTRKNHALLVATSLSSNVLQTLEGPLGSAVLDLRLRTALDESTTRVTAQIREVGAVYGALGRVEYLRKLIREANARRWGRRQALGLGSEQIAKSFSVEPDLPGPTVELDAGAVLILRGPIGAGKSDIGERWVLRSADRALSEVSAPVPVWLHSKEVGTSLERTILRIVGVETLRDFGVDVFVDALDEAAENGTLLTGQVDSFVAAWPKSRAIVSSREGGASVGPNTFSVPEWSSEESLALVSAIRGEDVRDYSWSESLKQATRRPLFALIAGLHLADVGHATAARLVEVCVARALGNTPFVPELQDLAVMLTDAKGGIDSRVLTRKAEVALAGSRLLEFSGKQVRFSLPIFEQWFAAQAILDGQVRFAQFAGDLVRFARWRYVLSVALAAGHYSVTSPIFAQLAKWNPGAASWALKEAQSNSFGGPGQDFSDWQEPALEIRQATEAWIAGLGHAAALVTPTGDGRRQVHELPDLSLGVTVDGGRVTQSWYVRAQGDPLVKNDTRDPMSASTDALTSRWGSPSSEQLWAMAWTQDAMVRALTKSLESAAFLFAPVGGLVDLEYQAWVLRNIANEEHIAVSEVGTSLLEQLLTLVSRDQNDDYSTFQFRSSKRMETRALRRLVERSRKGEVFAPFWPEPDLNPPRVGWVWGWYSTDRLLDRVRATSAGALRAYEEIRQALFLTFGDSLAHQAVMPARMIGSLNVPTGPGWEHQPLLSYHFESVGVPGDKGRVGASSVEINLTEVRGGWDETVRLESFTKYLDYIRLNPETSAFASKTWSSGLLDSYDSRPATKLALSWLAADLKSLGWYSGTGVIQLS